MKTELDFVRKQHEALGLPLRQKPERVQASELIVKRRLIRVETDEFLKNGLWADDLVQFSVRIGRMAFVVSSTLAQFGVEPELVDFAEALQSLIQQSRERLDKALAVSDWSAVKLAAVELEIIWYGAAANMGLPYFDLLQLLHDAYVSKRDLNFDDVRTLLHRAGLPVAPPANTAANDALGMSANGICPICQGNMPCGHPNHPGNP